MWPRESSYRSQKSGLPFSWFKNRREVRETVCKRLHRPSKFYHQSRELQYSRCIGQTHPLNLFQIFTGTNLATSFLIRSELALWLVYSLLFFVLGWITIILFWTMWYSIWTIVSPRLLKVPSKVRYSPPSNLRKLSTSVEEAIKKEFAEDLPMPQSFEHEVSFVLVGKILQTAFPTTISANIRSYYYLFLSGRWINFKFNTCKLTYRSSTGNLLNRTMIASPLWPSRWLLVTSVSNPSISTIFQLLLTLPVGSCSCERSFSALAPKVENMVSFIDGLQQAEWSCINLCKQRNPSRAARGSTAMGC